MMKRLSKFAVINLFCWTTLPAVADDISQYSTQQTAANTQNLVLNHPLRITAQSVKLYLMQLQLRLCKPICLIPF